MNWMYNCAVCREDSCILRVYLVYLPYYGGACPVWSIVAVNAPFSNKSFEDILEYATNIGSISVAVNGFFKLFHF